jgi:hypothetical protein
VFERFDAASGNAAVEAVTRGRSEATVSVDAPVAWTGAVGEVVTGAEAPVSGGKLSVVVPARQARVYVPR